MRDLIIIGASGHGKVCIDIAKMNGYKNIFFLDDDHSIQECNGYKVIGSVADYSKYLQSSDFFIAIGRTFVRQKIVEEIENDGGVVITLIHHDAVIASDVEIGIGSVVMAGAVINPGSKIGCGVIVNTSSSIDHDCRIGDYVHIAVGAHLSGTVSIGNSTWLGIGAVVSNNVNICSDCMIGAGTVVVKDIKESGTYVGVPARKVEKGISE